VPRLEVVSDHATTPECSGGLRTGVSGPDCLDYMADLILQLKGMAEERGYTALGGILEVAYQEARSRRACAEAGRSLSHPE